mmetsp:Transcript_29913/g.22163  ORF Transcript_29913/g.22163 Transcript_29913/m.22163 type:complete len:94 (+) Transcript_29913:846-1127(+)
MKEVFDFMSIFTLDSFKEFELKLKTFEGLMKQEGLSREEVLRKRSYVRICSLAITQSNHKYSDLANLLNMKEEDIEDWAIEAIQSRVIEAKID